MIPSCDVSSIDGYQGRETDIVVFLTVRCNVQYELGFLNDMRRLNVALTRARAAVIIIGDKATLTNPASDGTQPDSKKCWSRLIAACTEVNLEKKEERS